MSNPMSHMLWSEKLQMSQPKAMEFIFPVTAAKTVTAIPGVLTAFDAIASQSVINDFLGTTDEFLVAAFDGTAMGTDAFAAIIDMQGQAKEVDKVDCVLYTAAGAVTDEKHVLDSATLTASSLTTQIAKGASGNVAARVILTGLDAQTSGHIHMTVYWKSK